MNDSGYTMAAPTFLQVGLTTGCTLADLSVSGYAAPVYDEEEGELISGGVLGGQFILKTLLSNGQAEATYYWIDDGEKAKGWYDNKGKAIPGGAASVAIPAGKSLWISGKGLSLVTAGAVNDQDVAYITSSSGYTAVGNCTPMDLTLADLSVSGYDTPVYDEEEGELISGGVLGGQFILKTLLSNGQAEATYYWIDDGEKAKGWYDNKGKAISGGAASVAIPAGKGLWVSGKGLTLNVPAPEL